MLWLGVDTGGTFTDFVLFDGEGLRVHKVLSTPAAPEQAILQGISELGLTPNESLNIVHGSTVATNAVLEGKGVRTAYITNRGLADTLIIGRQARSELYNLQPQAPGLPVDRQLCLETGGRLSPNGEQVEPLTAEDLQQLKQALESLGPGAVAINLLYSFLDDSLEKSIEEIVPAEMFVSRSSSILPQYREYERGMTTWLNAYVGPLVQGYLQRLQDNVAPSRLAIMHSAGGTMQAEEAGRRAVQLLLSGPAGGLAGARFVAAAAGVDRLLTFDMGGTSTDVALIDGAIQLTGNGQVAGLPASVPMVDMHTIGAGGGSIASVDAGGLLQVGPESAGAAPGPACYGNGGTYATVTDANLVLGRLQTDAFLGGKMRLDEQAARSAVQTVADKLSCSCEQAAEGIIDVANEHMARALRVISIQRGSDPRDFVLASFGGAGGLHVCALADALAMHEALVPAHGGVLSALGMLAAPRTRELSRTVSGLLGELPVSEIQSQLDKLEQQGRKALLAEGVEVGQIEVQQGLDVCYQGQSYTFSIPWQDKQASVQAFHHAHEQRYGHRLELPVELVNVRVSLRGPDGELVLQTPRNDKPEEELSTRLYGIERSVAVYNRDSLVMEQQITGPALITETISTTYIAEGWQARLHTSGSLLLKKL